MIGFINGNIAEFKADVHHWLIEHAHYFFVTRMPRCGKYIIENFCELKGETE